MAAHYSQPKGFVGRQLIYKIQCDGEVYGAISAGSATRFLPGRDNFFGEYQLEKIINNTFYHLVGPPYPIRNFATEVIKQWRIVTVEDWRNQYCNKVIGFETLVELPRTGELYKRDGWIEVGLTKGYTCKRVAGKSTDSWTGKRVWDTINLRPKRVFLRMV